MEYFGLNLLESLHSTMPTLQTLMVDLYNQICPFNLLKVVMEFTRSVGIFLISFKVVSL